jgi:hypothetical protein
VFHKESFCSTIIHNSYSAPFAGPEHEPRFAYSTVRTATALGSAPEPKDVVEVTYIPTGNSSKVLKSVASVDFLTAAAKAGVAWGNCVGTLIGAGFGRLGRPNPRALQAAGNRSVRGPCYWADHAPVRETWFRTSIRLDFERMPRVKKGVGGKREDYMRIAIRDQIDGSGMVIGPYFVETVWNTKDGNRYWFDLYAPSEAALMAIAMCF